MDIRINGNMADITIESEETIGELLSGIETWLAGAGFRLSGLEVDGESVDIGTVPAVFSRNLQGIRRIDVKASSKPELLLEALYYAREYLKAFSEAPREEGRRIADNWDNSAAARFLSAELPLVSRELAGFFRGEGAGFQQLYALIEERIRELMDPRAELAGMEKQVAAIAHRLEDLPLDIQTGKDGRAAETITLFSNITEKLFRLFYQIRFRTPYGEADFPPLDDFSEDFNLTLKELLAAYEAKDVVLIGDLAEYELAPRLQSIYSSMNVPEVTPLRK
ncbi:MAG: hypothetical protein LBD78_10880 [Spirochaetaceae bacterium]|jgi:hypothetical protein|nr:hypothetical protein [Spirochaetaceae bacterium]